MPNHSRLSGKARASCPGVDVAGPPVGGHGGDRHDVGGALAPSSGQHDATYAVGQPGSLLDWAISDVLVAGDDDQAPSAGTQRPASRRRRRTFSRWRASSSRSITSLLLFHRVMASRIRNLDHRRAANLLGQPWPARRGGPVSDRGWSPRPVCPAACGCFRGRSVPETGTSPPENHEIPVALGRRRRWV